MTCLTGILPKPACRQILRSIAKNPGSILGYWPICIIIAIKYVQDGLKTLFMKFILLLLSVIVTVSVFSQTTESYYDFYWKPCSKENANYFSIVQKTDSGWLRKDYYYRSGQLQMDALYEDEACKVQTGHCYYYHANGRPSSIGRRIHGKNDGICLSYHSNGMMSDSANFQNGLVVDKRFRWHRNGYPSDSISRLNDSLFVRVTWFDDGSPSSAGYMVNDQLEGKWQYFHHNGQRAAMEVYNDGKLVGAEYFDESGKVNEDTSGVNQEARFKGGEEAWRKYLEKNLYWPQRLEFKTAAAVTIGVDFVVDENGKVIDAEVWMPFHEEYDKIALKAIKNSPAWLPAISHNRKVKSYRRQPVTFTAQAQ